MNGCKAGYKDGHKYCVKYRCPCLEKSCENYGELTNADKIRAMSDEELSCFLALAENRKTGKTIFDDTSDLWLKWLKQPAKEDE